MPTGELEHAVRDLEHADDRPLRQPFRSELANELGDVSHVDAIHAAATQRGGRWFSTALR
jgi:hypothetical protein